MTSAAKSDERAAWLQGGNSREINTLRCANEDRSTSEDSTSIKSQWEDSERVV
jgi:hypothetical protein